MDEEDKDIRLDDDMMGEPTFDDINDDDEEEYGAILRAKGILQDPDGKWFEFDYVPGELQIRPGQPDYTGRMVVIGANVEEAALKALFQA